MSFYLDPFKKNSPFDFHGNPKVVGLKALENTLEKHFFSQVEINICSSSSKETLLAIDLDCDLSLLEMLFHFNNGDLGNGIYLGALMKGLSTENHGPVDLEEFSIHLKDTSIVVNRIYGQSIALQLKNILTALGEHYVHFTRGLHEIPYEIFIPVFEEITWEIDGLLVNPDPDHRSKKDYFGFWGMYYSSQNDAAIYDLNNQALISGDLYTLNR